MIDVQKALDEALEAVAWEADGDEMIPVDRLVALAHAQAAVSQARSLAAIWAELSMLSRLIEERWR